MYTNIVVGYDESASSKAALTESSLWIKKHGGRLTLVHAVFFDEEEFAILPSQMETRFEVGAHVCRTAKQGLQDQFGLNGSVESYVCQGEPPAVLIETAEGRKADLIALGTYGRKGLKRLLMGSVTAQVILQSPCDVLVVKRPCSACTGSYTSLLVPFDGSDHSRKALGRAVELARQDGSHITALYVIPRYEEMVEFFRTDAIQKSLRREAEKVIAEAQTIAREKGVTVATEIRDGHAADEIIAAAGASEADLIMMGSHGWRGVNKAIMGSTTTRVLTDATVPVLVVK
jgi:nucleotide-binding universal stress UspA family protein